MTETKQQQTYPLTSLQREVWLHQSLHPNIALYTIGGYAHIEGALNIDIFQQALQQVIQQNDALRTILIKGADLPRQCFLQTGPFDFVYHDVSDQANAPQRALAWMQQRMATTFTLYDEPLYQFALIKIAPDDYYWFQKYHHIIVDGWGMSLIVQQVAAVYNALLNKDPVSPDSQPSYIDFIEANQAYLQSEQYQQDDVFWQDKFTKLPDRFVSFRYAKNFDTPEIPSQHSLFYLPRILFEQIEAFAKRHNAPNFQIILGALYVYFVRITQRDDFIIGLPTLNRTTPAFKETVGLFTNLVAAWYQCGQQLNFVELIISF